MKNKIFCTLYIRVLGEFHLPSLNFNIKLRRTLDTCYTARNAE